MDANPGSYALPISGSMHEMLLRQRGSDWFDAEGNIIIDSELSIDTMNWMLGLIDQGLAVQSADNITQDFPLMREGRYIAYPGADWLGGFFKDLVPDMSGKWKAMPLPAWEEGGTRTSVLGGTGAAIISTSPYVEEAWKFLEFAMLSVEGNVRRYELTTLFPPYIPAMNDPRLHTPDEYFSGQRLGLLFAEIGPEAPAQYQSPYRPLTGDLFSAAFQDIIDRNRTPEEVFRVYP
jgi:ABC-type sugar transport system, periplasmic component